MNWFLLAITLSLVLSLGYGWLAGTRIDRQAILWIAAALVATLAVSNFVSPDRSAAAILAVDLVLMVAITEIALRSARYWPTWFAGFHLAAVLFDLAALLVPADYVQTMRVFAGFWGVPAMLSMVLGIFLDRRADARRHAQAQSST